VHYHLSVYQQFSEAEEVAVPGYVDVEGRITPLEHLNLTELHQQRAELMLRLTDGRVLDFSVVNGEGTIHSTGRGLHG